MWGSTGVLRLFENELGGQIAWVLPAAFVLLALVLGRRAPRTDARRATLLLFGGWLIVTALAFSFMAGIFHAYYTVALAPALAGTVAIGASAAWAARGRLWVRILSAATALGTGVWAWALLDRAPDWLPWLRVVVLVVALAAGALLLLPPSVAGRSRALPRATIGVVLVAGLLAPTAYTLQTVTTAHSGSIVTAGPTVAGSMGGPGGGGRAGGGYQLATQESVLPIGGFNGSDPSPTLAQFKEDVAAGKIHYFIAGGIGRASGGSGSSSAIASWVERSFTAKTVDGVTLYDLTQ
ncbi:glucosaminyltransferase [Leifsonia xyli subsp. cynodontis DSM 46306]|uniref:Putative mannosyltransferase YkcA/B-like C-terminal domain-containing protein n=1 Tax=Leifsonia xyli subsp. cynodontis DSM 46306 TaxID=1389489 RepID=U3P7W3_LEIXC|nr:glucosaminyltransferase [Leifsonia xyli subsp. cynodontis DSM 46306]